MLSACRGVLQGEESVKITSLYILSLCLGKAGCTASETERTSEWAGSIETEKRKSVEALELKFLPWLYTATITQIQNMATKVLNDIPAEPEIRAARSSQGILEILVSAIACPNLPIDPLKMLSQVPDLKSDLFNKPSIETISNMTVFEREGARKDGLQVLTNLVASSKEKLDTVSAALRASVESGFKSDERQQRMRTIAFVRTIWNNCDSSFYFLVDNAIPALVEVALNADSTDVRQPALRLVNAMWEKQPYAQRIRDAVPTTLNNGLDGDSKKRHRVLTDLLEHLKDDESKVALEKPQYAFAWEDNINLVLAIFPVVFRKIVRIAIHDDSESVRDRAFCLLKELFNNGHVSGSLKVDVALAWLKAATEPGVCSRALHVLETFIDIFDLTNVGLLKKIIEWASADEHNDDLTPEMLEVVKEAILSLQDKVFSSEGDANVRALWVQFLADMEERVSSEFPEIVPIFADLYVKMESDTDLFESAHEDLLLLEEARLSKKVEEKLQLIAKEMRHEIKAKSSLAIQVEADESKYPIPPAKLWTE
ncbi:hypothetical protein EST38_g8455 [Candolleomyces aberdarensis]|uniref:Uncharacterized protein n=1 Tax=Candolleomyces aberdarensis TaxID=2316362 RepID=A0A4Q2DCF2_9AGAR|nr:hypothetical protein EST38_g8455 [Candolleomyces aberdarensis]